MCSRLGEKKLQKYLIYFLCFAFPSLLRILLKNKRRWKKKTIKYNYTQGLAHFEQFASCMSHQETGRNESLLLYCIRSAYFTTSISASHDAITIFFFFFEVHRVVWLVGKKISQWIRKRDYIWADPLWSTMKESEKKQRGIKKKKKIYRQL